MLPIRSIERYDLGDSRASLPVGASLGMRGHPRDQELCQKIDRALHELNTIAVSELRDPKDTTRKQIELPESGMGFFPEKLYVQTGQIAMLTLRVALKENEKSNH